MSFQEMLDAQAELQTIMPPIRPPAKDLPPAEQMDYTRTMVLALEDELHEFLGETGWKPWATSNHINVDAAKGELVDAFHFFMNLMLLVDMSAAELELLYFAKHKKNRKRQQEGYDGLNKCPTCKRAYDDDNVNCYPPGRFPGEEMTGWCSKELAPVTP